MTHHAAAGRVALPAAASGRALLLASRRASRTALLTTPAAAYRVLRLAHNHAELCRLR